MWMMNTLLNLKIFWFINKPRPKNLILPLIIRPFNASNIPVPYFTKESLVQSDWFPEFRFVLVWFKTFGFSFPVERSFRSKISSDHLSVSDFWFPNFFGSLDHLENVDFQLFFIFVWQKNLLRKSSEMNLFKESSKNLHSNSQKNPVGMHFLKFHFQVINISLIQWHGVYGVRPNFDIQARGWRES